MQARSVILLCVCILIPTLSHANVFVTEIMYDLSGADAGREWIEIYNASDVVVDLREILLIENGKAHVIKSVGETGIIPGTYAVIADSADTFRADWPTYTGTLFESAFSLSNKGETLTFKNGNAVVGTATYQPLRGGTGDSLQRDPNTPSFKAGIPTPGGAIPLTGLRQSETQVNAPRSVSSHVAPAPVAAQFVKKENMEERDVSEMISIETERAPLTLWLLGLSIIALGASIGAVYARHVRLDEWTIIEETD